MATPIEVLYKKDAIKLLRKSGTKVALQCGADACFTYAEKTDFINNLKSGESDRFLDYDGNDYVAYYNNGMLYVTYGTCF